MPDFERLIDRLRQDMAATKEERAWAEGYAAGKTSARWQCLVVACAVFVLVVVPLLMRP